MLKGNSLKRGIIFGVGDMVAIGTVASLAVLVRFWMGGSPSLLLYWTDWPALVVFLLTFGIFGLYPGLLLTPAEELKKICQGTSFAFFVLAMGLFLTQKGTAYSRGVFLASWPVCMVTVVAVRSFIRSRFVKKAWWGYPAVILGAGKTGEILAGNLQKRTRLGLRVIGFLDDDPAKQGTMVAGVPVLGTLADVKRVVEVPARVFAIVAMPGASRQRLMEILESSASRFRRLIVIPDLFGMSSLWASAQDIGGILGLEIQQKLLDPRRQAMKRVMDVVAVLTGGVFILPLLLCIGFAVKLDSCGPVLFRHKRIGLNGRDINIWKFRTMVLDADRVLEECLEKDSSMRKEWEENHKLAHDPRITRVGRFLRRTSLDEFPQLWNVLMGDLSLVGPRPIVWDEMEKYQEGFELYKKVKPGLTGLWQISGRSDTTYEDRVNLDSYYVRNWSVWFDIYILAKTPSEVFKCRGAC
jgi:Undecaprenyl-phosphate galactose phosphotransferase WbaP